MPPPLTFVMPWMQTRRSPRGVFGSIRGSASAAEVCLRPPIMFAVEDIEDVLARLHTHGAELVGELEQYEDSYRLCYVRGPEGVALAEQLS